MYGPSLCLGDNNSSLQIYVPGLGGQQQFFVSCHRNGKKSARLSSAAAGMCDDVIVVLQMNGNLDYEQVMPIIRERPY